MRSANWQRKATFEGDVLSRCQCWNDGDLFFTNLILIPSRRGASTDYSLLRPAETPRAASLVCGVSPRDETRLGVAPTSLTARALSFSRYFGTSSLGSRVSAFGRWSPLMERKHASQMTACGLRLSPLKPLRHCTILLLDITTP